MHLTDRAILAGTKVRSDGALIADARIARTGIQLYLGEDMGKPDMKTVRVYRPGSEVFSVDTMKSAAHRPVTNDHPKEFVSADNWKSVAVGNTADEVTAEGIYIRVPLMVSDGDTIKDIENGKRELSAGYTCDIDWTAGTTPNGEAYDAVQRNIRINHVAVVKHGRAGSEVRIGDAVNWGPAPINDEEKGTRSMTDKLRTILVDGLSVETTDQGAQAIEKLTKQLNDSTANIAKLTADHAAALSTKDKEHSAALATKDAEIDKLKKLVLSDADIEKRVNERSTLITVAKSLVSDVKTDGVANADIRKAVVIAKLGDGMKDKDQAYVDMRFDILVEDIAKADPMRQVIGDGITRTSDGDKEVADARAEMLKGITTGYRTAAAA